MSEFVALAEASRVSPGTMQPFDLSGREIVIANVGGDYFAFSNKCTCIAHFAGHVEGSSDDGHSHVGDYGHLIEGELKDGTVSCPIHTTVYDVKTGGPLKGDPARFRSRRGPLADAVAVLPAGRGIGSALAYPRLPRVAQSPTTLEGSLAGVFNRLEPVAVFPRRAAIFRSH